MKVLFIEPDKQLGKTLAEALEAHGHEVLIKRDAQSGLDGITELEPDVIILEIQLGKHNGIEFLYEINSYTDWSNIPIVLHTHNARVRDNEFKQAWEQLGVKKSLYKPDTTISRLNKAITSLV